MTGPRTSAQLAKLTPYKSKANKKRKRSKADRYLTANLEARGAAMETAAAHKRAKAKKDAERLAYLLANPKTP